MSVQIMEEALSSSENSEEEEEIEDMEVDEVDEKRLPSLPMEVWVGIFSFLSGPSLFRCEGVCRAWRREVQNLVATGKLRRRGLRLSRLSKQSGAVTEHKRGTWHSLSLMVDRRIVLVGVGVYYPSGQTTICVDARPLTEPLRPIDVTTELESEEEEDSTCITLFTKRGTQKPFQFVLEPNVWWEVVLNISRQAGRGEVWACRGVGGAHQVSSYGVNFSFRETVREGWVSEVTEGQFPYLYFWPC